MSRATVEAAQGAGEARGASGPAATSGRYLTLHLRDETYALPVEDVTEILEYRRPTPVPMMPPTVRGVIDRRGRAVPVIDTAVRFGGQATETGRRAAIVILERGHRAVGMLVDAVGAVVHLDGRDIEPPPEHVLTGKADVVAGMALVGDGFIVIVSTTALLSLDDGTAAGGAGRDTEGRQTVP